MDGKWIEWMWRVARFRISQKNKVLGVADVLDSTWVVSYSTSIDPIVISVTAFEIFDVKF